MAQLYIWKEQGRLKLRFDFHPALVGELKSRIPVNKRRWNPKVLIDRETGEKRVNQGGDDTWLVDCDMLTAVEAAAVKCGFEIMMGATDVYRELFGHLDAELMEEIIDHANGLLAGGDPDAYERFLGAVYRLRHERGPS